MRWATLCLLVLVRTVGVLARRWSPWASTWERPTGVKPAGASLHRPPLKAESGPGQTSSLAKLRVRSCVAVYRADHARVDVIPNAQGSRITPSVVAFTSGGTLVGEPAVGQVPVCCVILSLPAMPALSWAL